jgi:hypothetical protein
MREHAPRVATHIGVVLDYANSRQAASRLPVLLTATVRGSSRQLLDATSRFAALFEDPLEEPFSSAGEAKGANDGGTASEEAAGFRTLRGDAERLGRCPYLPCLQERAVQPWRSDVVTERVRYQAHPAHVLDGIRATRCLKLRDAPRRTL